MMNLGPIKKLINSLKIFKALIYQFLNKLTSYCIINLCYMTVKSYGDENEK